MCALLLLFASCYAKAQTPKMAAKYVVRETIGLTPALRVTGGKIALQAEARLELLTDKRVKPGMSDEDAMGLPPAKLRLFRADGTLAQEKTLERSRAFLKMAPPLYGEAGQETYLLTVDYSVGMGSYNGPITFLVEVTSGAMRYVSVGGKPITLMRSLKTDWKFAPIKSGGVKSTDILEVSCRPSETAKSDANPNNDFTVSYRRTHWNGVKWTRREKTKTGFWEDDGAFPSVALFPPAVP